LAGVKLSEDDLKILLDRDRCPSTANNLSQTPAGALWQSGGWRAEFRPTDDICNNIFE
jgi:hypothetical protein